MTKATCNYTSSAVPQPASLEAAQTSAASVVSGLDLGPGAQPGGYAPLAQGPADHIPDGEDAARASPLRSLPGGTSLTLRGAGRQAPHRRRTSS